MEIDRATFYALLVRVWQVIAGPITLLLIGLYFPPETQGWFYVFAELLALQSLVELNLSQIVINLASHEWNRLELAADGFLIGDPLARSRLVSLGRFFAKWYLGVGGLYFVVIGIGGGFWLASHRSSGEMAWQGPWIAVTFCTLCSLCLTPIYALLDGCNQVIATNRFRAVQSVVGNVCVWACIPLGAGLWTTTAIAATKLAGDLYPILGPYRRFFTSFFQAPSGPTVSWREEIAPLQWRLAIQTASSALAMSSLTLVLFEYHGETEAGRMGMTWSALKSLQWAALAWVVTRVPKFGMFISQKDFASLDRMFVRVFRVSLVLLICGGLTAWSVVALLNWFEHPISSRFLSIGPLAVLVCCVVLNHIPLSLGLYARAHKREPFVWLVVGSNLAITIAVWFGGRSQAGARGAAWGYLAVLIVLTIPMWSLIWWKVRRSWRE